MVQMNLFTRHGQRRRHTGWTCEHGVGGQEFRTHWESSTDTYTRPRAEWRASGKWPYGTVSSVKCSVMTQGVEWGCVGGRLKREGLNVYIQLIHFVEQQKHNIIKQLYFINNK